MKNIKDTCIEFLKSEDIKRDLHDIIKPVVNIVYNELYLYLWVICFYNIFLFFLILANLYLLLSLTKNRQLVSIN